jgi:hypothetical protein
MLAKNYLEMQFSCACRHGVDVDSWRYRYPETDPCYVVVDCVWRVVSDAKFFNHHQLTEFSLHDLVDFVSTYTTTSISDYILVCLKYGSAHRELNVNIQEFHSRGMDDLFISEVK